jgi:hypothetical protein
MSGNPTIRDRTQKSGARRNPGGSIAEKKGQRSGRGEKGGRGQVVKKPLCLCALALNSLCLRVLYVI